VCWHFISVSIWESFTKKQNCHADQYTPKKILAKLEMRDVGTTLIDQFEFRHNNPL
jgi:hypothetical protein